VLTKSTTTDRRDGQRWELPGDKKRTPDSAEPDIVVLPYAVAAGLFATLMGGLVSLAVPGRGFLVVWAAVSLGVAITAGRMAERIHAALMRALARLISTH
jgi:hypothetical protein